MIKTKWLEVRLPCELFILAEKMQGHSYRRGGESGIDLLDLRKDRVAGRFTQEVVQTEVIKDPFGEEFEVKSKRYLVFDFLFLKLDRKHVLLRLDSPPRSVKTFIEKLYAIVGFGLFFAPVEIDVMSFINLAKRATGIHQLRVTRVRASGLMLNGRASAKIDVSSQHNAYQDLTEAFKIASIAVEKACVCFSYDGSFRSIEITQTGGVAVEDDLIEAVTGICLNFFKSTMVK